MLPALFEILLPVLNHRQLTHLAHIFSAIFAMTGAVSMRSISRLSSIPYRTIQRFYAQVYPWNKLRFILYNQSVAQPTEGTVLLSIDEVVEDKCGQSTFGLAYFYGGLYQKVVKGIGVLQMSAVHTNSRKSYPLAAVQLQQNESDKAHNQARKAYLKDLQKRKAEAQAAGVPFVGKKRGRKKGSKNRPKDAIQTTDKQASMLHRHTKTLLDEVLTLYREAKRPQPPYLVGDGSFGNQHYVALAQASGIHLISKLKKNAQLTLPFTGKRPKGKRGPNQKYGQDIDLNNIDKKHLIRTGFNKTQNTQVNIYSLKAYNKEISKDLLNIVLIEKIQVHTGKKSRVILFSTDLQISPNELIDYYELRFPIEIDFRDAKQYFGLRDFKNIKERQVTNAIQIAITAKLVAQICADQLAQQSATQHCSILDVKTYFRTNYYLRQVIKLLPKDAKQFLSHHNIIQIAQQEAIHLKNAA